MATQSTETRIGVTVEQYRTVNTVFEHLRPSQRAVFGDVADHHNRHAARFGKTRQVSRRFAHLRHTARRRLNIRHVHYLNGVDHHQLRLFFFGNQANLFDTGFRQHIQIRCRQAKPVRSHRHLLQ